MSRADSSLEDLNRWLREHDLHGYWMRDDGPTSAPLKPRVWKWADIEPGLLRSGDLVPVGPRGLTEMRTLALKNDGAPGMGNTISLGPQILMPGERTRAHRNVKNETRFVVKAPPEAIFIADGEAFPMGEGDLIVSPTWTDHDHYNGGAEPAIWLDGLDMGLMSLAVDINERYPEDEPYQATSKPEGYGVHAWGDARPSWIKQTYPRPAIRYPWAETHATLLALRDAHNGMDPFNGFRVHYASPVDGGSTLPTFSCEAQILPPKLATRAHRHNSTAIYYAFRGEGSSVVDDVHLAWAQGDIFLVPPWTWHSHENRASTDAILFSIDDWPAMTSLGLYREENSPA